MSQAERITKFWTEFRIWTKQLRFIYIVGDRKNIRRAKIR